MLGSHTQNRCVFFSLPRRRLVPIMYQCSRQWLLGKRSVGDLSHTVSARYLKTRQMNNIYIDLSTLTPVPITSTDFLYRLRVGKNKYKKMVNSVPHIDLSLIHISEPTRRA